MTTSARGIAPNTASFYSPQLDGLRFLAALLVFLHHAPEVAPHSPLSVIKSCGWVGVDLFLCISAFLLTRLICLEFGATGQFRIGDFFVRRALRIWPLYLGYASVMSIAGWLVFRLDGMTVASWWLSHLSFSNNLMTAAFGYSPVPYTAHLWTIALEEQVYLILPLLLSVLLSRAVPSRIVAILVAGSLILLMIARLALFIGGAVHPFVWVLPLRADAVLLGTATALLNWDRAIVPAGWLLAASIALFCSVALFGAIDARNPYQVYGYTITALAACGIVTATQHPLAINRILAATPMRYLGKISFGIYVYHPLAIATTIFLLKRAGIVDVRLWVAASFGTTVLAAALSYRIYERPFLKLKERYARVRSRPA